ATAATPPWVGVSGDDSSRPACGSQNRTTGSPRIHEEVATVRPSGEKATDRIGLVWPGKGSIRLPVAVSQSTTPCALLPPPVAKVFESGAKKTCVAQPSRVGILARSRPPSRSHSRREPSELLPARVRASGLKESES